MSRRKDVATRPTGNNVLQVPTTDTKEQLIAKLAVEGVAANAATTLAFTQGQLGEGDFTEAVSELRKNIQASKDGDTSLSDTFLVSQAAVLNALFNELVRRSASNMGEYPEAMERYMRLALKAQSQCSATLERLARIKNPPNVAFVRQANIAHGPQQVNNGASEPTGMPNAARTGESANAPIELLENSHGEWMDPRATGEAGRGDPAMAPVGKVDRSEDSSRKNGRKR